MSPIEGPIETPSTELRANGCSGLWANGWGGCAAAPRLWVPACAGTTESGSGVCGRRWARGFWAPASAGETERAQSVRVALRFPSGRTDGGGGAAAPPLWVPACAGTTESGSGVCGRRWARGFWAPASAGETERAQSVRVALRFPSGRTALPPFPFGSRLSPGRRGVYASDLTALRKFSAPWRRRAQAETVTKLAPWRMNSATAAVSAGLLPPTPACTPPARMRGRT